MWIVAAAALPWFSSHALAEGSAQQRLLKAPGPTDRKAPVLVLLELDRQAEILKTRETTPPTTAPATLLPNRVYWFRNPKDGDWYFVFTNARGHFPKDPPEFVRHGSVFSGRDLGSAKSPTQRFILNRQMLWIPTFHKERHDFWVEAAKPYIKMEEYRDFLPLAQGKKPGGGK